MARNITEIVEYKMKKLNKREKIKLLLQLNRTGTGIANNIAEILGNMDHATLEEDAEEFERFKTYLTTEIAAAKDAHLEGMVNIYDKHLSEECVDGALEYYMSASGREMSENIPAIQQELITLSMDMLDRIMEGYDGIISKEEFSSSNKQHSTTSDLEDFKKRYGLQ